jgi:hypothetical protein
VLSRLEGYQVTLVVEADRDGIDDLERVNALRLEIAKADDHPASVAKLSGFSERAAGSATSFDLLNPGEPQTE